MNNQPISAPGEHVSYSIPGLVHQLYRPPVKSRTETCRVWFPVDVGRKDASFPPGDDEVAFGTPTAQTFAFDPGAANAEYCHWTVPAPHNLVDRETVDAYLVWIPDPSWTSGNYIWGYIYQCATYDDGSTTSGDSGTGTAAAVTPPDTTTVKTTLLKTGIDLNVGELMIIDIYLSTSSTGDDDGHAIALMLEYTGWRVEGELPPDVQPW